jgi:PIN domain nuclease of toxin-antitoxin system
MKYLIDTHTFLWFNEGASEISQTAKALIENKDNEILISIASLWEISIKSALGKLIISNPFETVIEDVIQSEIDILPINFTHLVRQNKLPFHHKDPFDRIVISQALAENVDIISKDVIFDNYLNNSRIVRIW